MSRTLNPSVNKVLVFTLFIVAICQPAVSSPSFKIGLATWSGYPESVHGFKDGLASVGLIEGKNVTFIKGETGADEALQQKVALSFKQQKVDLVYSLTTPGTTIIKSILEESTPIVFSIVTYPADSGLIESFEYSGNNLVGTSNYVSIRHYLTLLKLIQPRASRIAIFHKRDEPNSQIQASNMIRILKRNNIKGISVQPESIEDVRSLALKQIGKVDAFMTTTDTLMQSGGEDVLIELSLKHKIPVLSSNKLGIQNGATYGPVVDFYTLGKISGKQAAKILTQNIKPAALESKQQDPPLFLVNKQSIKKLSLPISNEAKSKITWVNE